MSDRRFSRYWFVPGMLAIVIGLSGCASHDRTTAERPPAIVAPADFVPQRPTIAFPGVANFGVVSTDVWRGAKPTPEGMRALAEAGVKTVIDLQQGDESPDVPAGVRYVRLPVSGWHADRVDLDAVLHAIDENPKPVFIHCREGRDRTGLAVAAYRVDQGMALGDAFAELEAFHVHPWWRTPIERRVRDRAGLSRE